MTLPTVVALSLVAVVAIAIPGPTTLLALANGSRLGLRRSVSRKLGAVASDFVLVTAVAVGLGGVLAHQVGRRREPGVYLGIRLLLSKGHFAPARKERARSA